MLINAKFSDRTKDKLISQNFVELLRRITILRIIEI